METDLEIEIKQDLHQEKKEIDIIEKKISRINENLLDKVPSHFSKRDIINAIFGSLILGLTFILKGGTINTAVNLNMAHTIMIVCVTILILVAEIYYISYTRVKDKSARKLGQFLFKRLITLYAITICVSFALIYLFNLQNHELVLSFLDVIKLVFFVSFPCAVGAAVPSLLKHY